MLIRKALGLACLLLIILLQGCVSVNIVPPPAPLKEHVIEGRGRPKILLLDVSGFISERERGGNIVNLAKKPSTVVQVREALQKAGRDDDIAGVIIKINSPGGTVTASDIIYHELMSFKERKKVPVYACITGIGTSGSA